MNKKQTKVEKKKLTFKHLVKELDRCLASSREDIDDDGRSAINKLSDQYDGDLQRIQHLGAIELAYEEGGYEAGPHFEQVFLFMNHQIYIKLQGTYSSYEGVYWGEDKKGDEFTKISQVAEEVFPQDKIITVYKTQKEINKEEKKKK